METLGPYVLERELGRGAMARVWLARDARKGQQVALKVLELSADFRGATAQDARQAFVREAMLAASLHHPDIVAVLEAGKDGERAWLAMEYVPGIDLGAHTHAGALLPPWQAVSVMARAARAIAHAHAAGVVHSDIKPANILCDFSRGSVKVMDFGIALGRGDARRAGAPLLGSPSYMAPELMQGGEPDALSDVYALGVSLFQLLSGSLPFRGDSLAELMDHICHQPPLPLRTLCPALPQALERVVMRAMARERTERFASALLLAQALESGSGVPALPPGAAGDCPGGRQQSVRPAKIFDATTPVVRPTPARRARAA